MAYKQGWYKLKHPEKYVIGDGSKDCLLSSWTKSDTNDNSKIRCMSSWEFKTCQFLDNNPNILRWSSEEFYIPYIKPTTGRVHRYFPDYWVEYQDKHGNIIQEIWEVKPLKETRRPRASKRKNPKTKLYEDLTWAINQAKWQAATQFCKQHNVIFRIMTEQDIFR